MVRAVAKHDNEGRGHDGCKEEVESERETSIDPRMYG
jgi:hypothetical protein